MSSHETLKCTIVTRKRIRFFFFSKMEDFLLLWTVFWVIFLEKIKNIQKNHKKLLSLFFYLAMLCRAGCSPSLWKKQDPWMPTREPVSSGNVLQGDCGFHMKLPKLYWLFHVGIIHITSSLASPDQICKCWLMGFALFHDPETLFLTTAEC